MYDILIVVITHLDRVYDAAAFLMFVSLKQSTIKIKITMLSSELKCALLVLLKTEVQGRIQVNLRNHFGNKVETGSENNIILVQSSK